MTCDPQRLIEAIQNVLTPGDLRGKYKDRADSGCPVEGHCSLATEVLQALLWECGERQWKARYAVDKEEGLSHWWLVDPSTGEILDPTVEQFYYHDQEPPYHLGRGGGFQRTRWPVINGERVRMPSPTALGIISRIDLEPAIAITERFATTLPKVASMKKRKKRREEGWGETVNTFIVQTCSRNSQLPECEGAEGFTVFPTGKMPKTKKALFNGAIYRQANPMWWRGSGGDFHVDPLSRITVRDVPDVFDEMIDVQCDSYDSNPYMHGMANGMIYMRSLIDGQDPEFMEAPDVWLDDLPPPACGVETDGGNNVSMCEVPSDVMQEADPELFLDDEYEEEYLTARVEGRNMYHPPGMTLDQWEMEKRRRRGGSARQWVRNNAPDQSRGEARRARNPFKKERKNPDPPGTVVETIVETCGRNYHPEECRDYEKGFRWAMSELEPFVVMAADPTQDREYRAEAERVFDMVKNALRNPGIQRQLIAPPYVKAIILPLAPLGEEEYSDVAVAFTPKQRGAKGSMAIMEGHPLFKYGMQLDVLPESFFDLSHREALEALPYYITLRAWTSTSTRLRSSTRTIKNASTTSRSGSAR
jgi:hypothetical protein